MGANFSALFRDPNGATPGFAAAKPGLGDLPESCVALIIGSLDPTEICKLARLNRAFRGASLADFVWESKLPPNYRTLIEEVFGDLKKDLGKREIYARLCRMNSFDGGTKVISFVFVSIARNCGYHVCVCARARARFVIWDFHFNSSSSFSFFGFNLSLQIMRKK